MDDRKFGGIEFAGKDIGVPEVPFDRLAINSRGELLLLSVFTDQMRVKQIRAILCGGAKAIGNASGVQVGKIGCQRGERHTPGRINPTSDGYQTYTHKLGFNVVHAMFITRTPGFMKVVTEESLWQELNGPRFTTPVLRDWMPYIEKQLRDNYLLENASTFGCQCGILTASTKSLDDIVSTGLANHNILVSDHSDKSEAA